MNEWTITRGAPPRQDNVVMDHREAGRYWEQNAAVWTQLARAGFDGYRDGLNTPAFVRVLPEVAGLRGLDIGCGEGHHTRLLARRGAHMTGIDVSPTFISHALQPPDVDRDLGNALTPEYVVGSAVELPFAAGSFDFATAFMSLMEFPESSAAFVEAFRVLRPGGFLQFSLPHPCFDTPHRRNLRNATGQTYAIEVGGYFEGLSGKIEEWIFRAAPAETKAGLRKFRIPRFTRTLSSWIELLLQAGFQLEMLSEPRPSDDDVRQFPFLQDAQVVAYFLCIRVRKPLASQ